MNFKVKLAKKRNALVSQTFKGQLQSKMKPKKMTGIALVSQDTIMGEILRQSEAMYSTNTAFKDATSCSLAGGKRVSFLSNTGAAPLRRHLAVELWLYRVMQRPCDIASRPYG